MKEFLSRLMASPQIAVELLVSSFFVNVLALASSLFVMQVLNRFVAHGVHSTLVMLISGVLIAIVLEFIFRKTRMKIARGISVIPDEYAAFKGFGILTRAKTSALEKIPAETRREMLNGMQAVETAYNATNITAVLDVPFSFVFVGVLYLLEPTIALVVVCFILLVFFLGVYGSYSARKQSAEAQEASSTGSTLVSTATREADTIRAFNAGSFLREAWLKHQSNVHVLRRNMTERQGVIQTISQSANGLMSVVVISVGALLVVSGNMDVGAMIGANILASRALQPISKFSQMGSSFAKAREALATFKKLEDVPLEPEQGSAITDYRGAIEFRDLAFAFEGSNTPLFESLNLKLDAGNVLIITGGNGTGKTTFARLLMGLLEPSRGQILVDGLDLQQVAPEWWRRQVAYLPQEPALLNATIEDNLRINNADIHIDAINQAIDAAGLRRFLDETPQGLNTEIVDNGWRLSEGIRRRMALARALTSEANIAIIDEPTESLDEEGCAAVHTVLKGMASRGRTIIIMSHNPNVVQGAYTVVDLDAKPVPKITKYGSSAPSDDTQGAGNKADTAAKSAQNNRTIEKGAVAEMAPQSKVQAVTGGRNE
jgi:ATP-binding cassette subfamily C protein LapB